jgi:hypothetical protein
MRQRCCVVFFLLALASKNGAAAQVEHADNSDRKAASMPWVPETYPNPDLDQRACRTVLNRLCDPDAILQEPEVKAIEENLRRDRPFEPKCSPPRDQQEVTNVQIGVALVERVSLC